MFRYANRPMTASATATMAKPTQKSGCSSSGTSMTPRSRDQSSESDSSKMISRFLFIDTGFLSVTEREIKGHKGAGREQNVCGQGLEKRKRVPKQDRLMPDRV